MIVNTQRLFKRLLSSLRISVICDVGSMNGADALEFRAAMINSSIYAFEPNPQNFRLMQSNRILSERSIQLAPLAASDVDGEAEFFIVDADYERRDYRRGMSSLYRRQGEKSATQPVRVNTTRLDTFLSGKCSPEARLALWIDAEGKAFEIIQGMSGVANRVWLVHVEVETVPCIGSGQKLYADVAKLLRELGLSECATDQPRSAEQFNALFLRSEMPQRARRRARTTIALARMHRWLFRAARMLCPACVRRYQANKPRAFDP